MSVREMERTAGFWLGRLSATVGIAAEALDHEDPKRARKDLRATLAEFVASPVLSEELRKLLREYLR